MVAFLQVTQLTSFTVYIEKINRGPLLEDDQILVTWDVEGLYTNIPYEEGLQSLHEGLET